MSSMLFEYNGLSIHEYVSSQKNKYTCGKENFTEIKYLLLKQDFHVIADSINHLSSNKLLVFSELPPEIQSEVILHLSEDSKQLIIPKMSMYDIARFLHFNDEDDATDILQYLSVENRTKI